MNKQELNITPENNSDNSIEKSEMGLNFYKICLGPTTLQKYLLDHPIFSQILSKFPPIPFEEIKEQELSEKGLLPENKEEKKIKVDFIEKYVYISKLFKYLAAEANTDFTVLDGHLCYYNGHFWEIIEHTLMLDILAISADKAGMLVTLLETPKVKKSLLNQFVSICNTPPFELDTKKILINVKNGTLDLSGESPKLRTFNREDMLRYQLSFDYNSAATCPEFKKFINWALPEQEAQDLLMEMIGYCFIPTKELKLETALILLGSGSNGKGVVYELVKEILGKEHVTGFSLQALSFDANARAQLSGKLLNYSSELGGKCEPEAIKKLISGEDIEVKTLYKDMDMLKDYSCKLMFNANTLPKETEANNAFFRRWIILPFNQTISNEQKDVRLPDKLKIELPGIFNLVLEGVCRLKKNRNFTHSPLAANELEKYKIRANTVLQFIKEEGWIATVEKNNTERQNSTIPHVTLIAFYEEYSKYCQLCHSTPCAKTTFNERIYQSFYVQKNCTGNATWVFCQKETINEPEIPSNNPIDDLIKSTFKL